MTAIWELDNLLDLEQGVRRAWQEAEDIAVDDFEQIEESDVDRVSIQEVWVVGPWANDTATYGEDEIRIELAVDAEDIDEPSQVDFFMQLTGWLADTAESLIDNLPSAFGLEDFVEAGGTDGIEINRFPIDVRNGQLQRLLGRGEGNRVVNLTEFVARPFREGVPFNNLPIEQLDVLRDRARVEVEEEPEEGEETEEEEIVEEEALTPEEQLAEHFPDVPPMLRSYAVQEDRGVTLKIKSGVRWEKKVQPREMYPFEVIQATNRPTPQDIPYSAPVDMTDEVAPGIGEAISAGFFDRTGPARQNQVPPSTFPRTGTYIKNYLRHRGPAYALMLYNDFLVYLGYVNKIHRKEGGRPFELNIGTYESFREYIYVLKQVPERHDAPQLIIPLSQQQAASRGLETVPDHPTIPGEKAPWLARRQWYDINEDAFDHPAWDDPYSFVHGEREEEESS